MRKLKELNLENQNEINIENKIIGLNRAMLYHCRNWCKS